MRASAMPLMPQHPVAIAGNVPLPPLRPVPVPPRQPKPEIAYAHGLTQVARLTTAPAAVPATTPLPRTHPAQHEIALPTVHQIGIQVAAQIAAAVPPAAPPAEKLVPPVQEAHNKSPALPTADSRTAVYDIAAHTVYLPNGQRLEAHSGLYDKMDDPRFVHIKMRGPTPPNVYELTLREQLFHGVRAIRLNPVDDNKMFGRDGILAHTYMLGPNGQSNGCVSFRDYEKFLQAYLRGEVDRMVVVASLGRRPPLLASRPVDDGWRSASNF
jgi:hypothetical protein